MLRTVANRLQYLLQTRSNRAERQHSDRQMASTVQHVFQNILRSVSNLFGETHSETWKDLHTSRQTKVATSLLVSLEQMAFLLSDVIGIGNDQEEYVEEASKEICECF